MTDAGPFEPESKCAFVGEVLTKLRAQLTGTVMTTPGPLGGYKVPVVITV